MIEVDSGDHSGLLTAMLARTHTFAATVAVFVATKSQIAAEAAS